VRVKNLNVARGGIKCLRDRIAKDLRLLGDLCSSLGSEVERRYHEEVSLADGDTEGLDEFQVVARELKRDGKAISGALSILTSQVRGASGYDFEEMDDQGRDLAGERK